MSTPGNTSISNSIGSTSHVPDSQNKVPQGPQGPPVTLGNQGPNTTIETPPPPSTPPIVETPPVSSPLPTISAGQLQVEHNNAFRPKGTSPMSYNPKTNTFEPAPIITAEQKQKQDAIAQETQLGIYQGEGGSINSVNAAIQKANDQYGITYVSGGGGGEKSGGSSARDIYVGTLLGEYEHGYVAGNQNNPPLQRLSNELGLIGLSYNPQTKVISDPLMESIKARDIENAYRDSFGNLYGGSGAAGPSTRVSSGLGISLGQVGLGYYNPGLSLDQRRGIEEAKAELIAPRQPEYAGNQNFLYGNIGTENSTGIKGSNPIAVPIKNPEISKADLSSLGKIPLVNIGGHLIPASLVTNWRGTPYDQLSEAERTPLSNFNLVDFNAVGNSQDVFQKLSLSLSDINATKNSQDVFSYENFIEKAKQSGSPTIQVNEITRYGTSGLTLVKSHPFATIKTSNAEAELKSILNNNNGKELQFVITPVQSQNTIGAGMEFVIPYQGVIPLLTSGIIKGNLMSSAKTIFQEAQFQKEVASNWNTQKLNNEFVGRINTFNDVIRNPNQLQNPADIFLINTLKNLQNVLTSGVSLAGSVGYQLYEGINTAVKQKPNLQIIGGGIGFRNGLISPEIEAVTAKNLPYFPEVDIVTPGVSALVVGGGLAGFKTTAGTIADIASIGSLFIGSETVLSKFAPVRLTKVVLEPASGLVGTHELGTYLTLGSEEGGSKYVIGGKLPSGKVVLGTPNPSEYFPLELPVAGRGFTRAEGSGLFNKLVNSNQVLEYQKAHNILTGEDISLVKTTRDVSNIVQKSPVKIYNPSFGNKPLEDLTPGETKNLIKFANYIQTNNLTTPLSGSFADIPFVPNPSSVGDLDVGVLDQATRDLVGTAGVRIIPESGIAGRQFIYLPKAVKGIGGPGVYLATGEQISKDVPGAGVPGIAGPNILIKNNPVPENLFYHGTTEENAESILRNGFDFEKSQTSENTIFAASDITGAKGWAATHGGKEVLLGIKIKPNAKILDVNKLKNPMMPNEEIRALAHREKYDIIENLMQGIPQKGREIEIVRPEAIESISPLSKNESERYPLFGEVSQETKDLAKKADKIVKIIDLPIKGVDENEEILSSQSGYHKVFGIKEPMKTFKIEGVEIRQPQYNTLRRVTTITRMGGPELKTNIPNRGITTRYGNYTGPEYGRLKDAARVYRGYVLDARSYLERNRLAFLSNTGLRRFTDIDKAEKLISAANVVKNTFEREYSFEEAFNEIKTEKINNTIVNTTPEESDTIPFTQSTKLNTGPISDQQKKNQIKDTFKGQKNNKSSSISKSTEEKTSLSYKPSISKDSIASRSVKSLINTRSIAKSLIKKPRSQSIKSKIKSPSKTLPSKISNTKSISSRPLSIVTPYKPKLNVNLKTPSVQPSITKSLAPKGNVGVKENLNLNPYVVIVKGQKRPFAILFPGQQSQKIPKIEHVTKERQDYLGNSSEYQIEGLYNRNEIVYGSKKVSSLARRDYSFVFKKHQTKINKSFVNKKYKI